METLKFKTTLSTPSTLKKIAPIMKRIKGLQNWTVDFESVYKLLIVEGIGLEATEIINSFHFEGYQIVRLYEEG